MTPDATPRLAAGCRLHPSEPLLLIPEGALKLTGPSREVLLLVNGQRSVGAIAEELAQQYAGANPAEVQQDVLDLLDRMQQRGFIRA